MQRYGLYGETTRDFLTWRGKVLIHENAAEMEFLVHGSVKVREIPKHWPEEMTTPLRNHPDMEVINWPLDRRQFRA